MVMPSVACDRCGYAIDTRRVMLLVESRPMNEHRLCHECLHKLFDVLQGKT